jgi:DNA-binding NarL/FixJ family response regulator
VAENPHIRVVALSMHKDSVYVREILRAGARGYLLKGADHDQIRRAVGAAAAGEAIFGTEIAARVLDHFARQTPPAPAIFPRLTDRERQVLDMVAQGQSNAFIASRLRLSQKTVRNNVSNILVKLQVSDRAQAIVRARDAGLGRH